MMLKKVNRMLLGKKKFNVLYLLFAATAPAESTMTCPENEVYKTCGPNCDAVCETYKLRCNVNYFVCPR